MTLKRREDMERTEDEKGNIRYDGIIAIRESIQNKMDKAGI